MKIRNLFALPLVSNRLKVLFEVANLHDALPKKENMITANQTNRVLVLRYRLLILEDKNSFPRKAAMDRCYT
jgi:hypothetical protein